MKQIILIAALAGVPAVPAVAQASQPTLSAMIAGLEADGYQVTDVDVDSDRIKVEATAQDGRAVEMRLDPQSGEILDEAADG